MDGPRIHRMPRPRFQLQPLLYRPFTQVFPLGTRYTPIPFLVLASAPVLLS